MSLYEYLPGYRDLMRAVCGVGFTEQTVTSKYPETNGEKFTKFVLNAQEIAEILELVEKPQPLTIENIREAFGEFFGEHYGTLDIIGPPVMAVIVTAALWSYKVREPLIRENFHRDGLN